MRMSAMVVMVALVTALGAAGCSSSSDSAGEEACGYWVEFRQSQYNDLVKRDRALTAAKKATSGKYEYLASDMQAYLEARDRMQASDLMGSADAITAFGKAGEVVLHACGIN
jgi:ABC-type glycerol-3-phosphate transport system substrate-binding protein